MACEIHQVPSDIRETGFANRASVDEAFEWIDRFPEIADSEEVPLDEAVGRMLAQPFITQSEVPSADIAIRDGYALRSCETVGAGSYNPLLFCLQDCHSALRPFSAALITSGTPLPLGADAVAPFDLAHVEGTTANVIGPVAEGEGVIRKGHDIQKGVELIDNSRPLRASDIGLMSSFGVNRIRVTRRPRVRIIVAGSKSSPAISESWDANGPMLRARIVQDGGVVETFRYRVTDRNEMACVIAQPGADVVLVCGRTGTGPDDDAPLALRTAGTLSIHGIAVRPGDSTGMGSVGNVPVLLLPGSPLDCFCAYDLFAGRLIRTLSGYDSRFPYRVVKAKAARKIVSSVGTVELCLVRLEAGVAVPIGTGNSRELTSVARADGFILIPATLEGYAPGTPVSVYVYDQADCRESARR